MTSITSELPTRSCSSPPCNNSNAKVANTRRQTDKARSNSRQPEKLNGRARSADLQQILESDDSCLFRPQGSSSSSAQDSGGDAAAHCRVSNKSTKTGCVLDCDGATHLTPSSNLNRNVVLSHQIPTRTPHNHTPSRQLLEVDPALHRRVRWQKSLPQHSALQRRRRGGGGRSEFESEKQK